jgi:hypothetical protein
MKKILKYLILILIIPLLFTCKKENKITFVSGIAIDRFTHHPIANADIIIIKCKADDGGVPYDQHTVITLKTDDEGKFNYEYYADTDYPYHYLFAQKPSECCGGDNWGIKPGEKNYSIIEMTYWSYYSLHIKNNTPFDNNDGLCVYYSIYPITITSCNTPMITGMNINYYTFRGDFGNRYLHLKWFVTKNGLQTIYQDSVFLTPCDTINYEILY